MSEEARAGVVAKQEGVSAGVYPQPDPVVGSGAWIISELVSPGVREPSAICTLVSFNC